MSLGGLDLEPLRDEEGGVSDDLDLDELFELDLDDDFLPLSGVCLSLLALGGDSFDFRDNAGLINSFHGLTDPLLDLGGVEVDSWERLAEDRLL